MMNCAVIGLGNMGVHHARIYNELGNGCKLVAAADINPSTGRCVTERLKCRCYEDFREMIEKESIQAVSIAVPTYMHEEVSLACLRKRIHVLLEKPIASDLAQAENITRVAQEEGVVLQVGHIEHFNPAVIKLKEILSQNALGRLITIMVRRVGITPPQIKDANVVIDLAIHDIDLCNFLTERLPNKIYCRAGAGILSDREDFADIFLEYNGINALIQSNWITPVKIRKMHLTGTEGYAELDFIEQKLHLAKTIVEKDCDLGSKVLKFVQSKMIEIEITRSEPLKLEIEHFLDCVAGNKKPFIDGKRATDALRIALEAWKTGTRNPMGRHRASLREQQNH